MYSTFAEKHIIANTFFILLLSLGLSACGPEFNAKAKPARTTAAVQSNSDNLSVDKRIKLGGIHEDVAGTTVSARQVIVVTEQKVAGSQVSGKLRITY